VGRDKPKRYCEDQDRSRKKTTRRLSTSVRGRRKVGSHEREKVPVYKKGEVWRADVRLSIKGLLKGSQRGGRRKELGKQTRSNTAEGEREGTAVVLRSKDRRVGDSSNEQKKGEQIQWRTCQGSEGRRGNWHPRRRSMWWEG